MPHPLAGTIAEYVWAVPLLPLLGFVINGLLSLFTAGHPGPADPSSGHDAHDAAHDAAHDDHAAAPSRPRFGGLVSFVGPAVLVLAFGLGLAIFMAVLGASPATPFVQTYYPWMPVGDLQVNAAFQVDQLSILMVLVITGVGTLIHLFSVGYMREDPGYARYFAYLNLFVFFMLVLVLGANYPILFIGWEGVGLCSYLLIGFWFSVEANADAGKKAFIVNRIGDFGLLLAMFMLFANLGSLDFTNVFANATSLGANSPLATTICLFLFLGCVGKSAQIPLYVWLPDAMAGPTPVSALIHAATMVTAGVYLIARSSALFAMAPAASLTVCVVGGVTALFAATIGLKQWDIKKVLAYSTISQLGYMFVGVGASAYVAGMFHLVTHAFFKALLFLGAGSVIYAMHAAYHATHNHDDAQDMRNMGGLRHAMPWTWALMWIATLAICGIPPFAGFSLQGPDPGHRVRARPGIRLADAHWLGIPGRIVLVRRLRHGTHRGAADGDLHDPSHALHVPWQEPDRGSGTRPPAGSAVDHDRPARGARALESLRWFPERAVVHPGGTPAHGQAGRVARSRRRAVQRVRPVDRPHPRCRRGRDRRHRDRHRRGPLQTRSPRTAGDHSRAADRTPPRAQILRR